MRDALSAGRLQENSILRLNQIGPGFHGRGSDHEFPP